MNASILFSCRGTENTGTEAPVDAGSITASDENQTAGLEEKFADLLDEDLIAAALNAEMPGVSRVTPGEAGIAAEIPALPGGRETEGETGPATLRTKMIKLPIETAASLNKILPEPNGRVTQDTALAAPKPEIDPSVIETSKTAPPERTEPRTRAFAGRSGIAASDIIAGHRKPNPGLKNIGESFPLGWEVLLEDDTPALHKGDRKSGGVTTKLKPLVLPRQTETGSGSGKKTAPQSSKIPAESGLELKSLHSAEKPADPGRTAFKIGDSGPKAQPELQIEMPIDNEVNLKPLSSQRPVGVMPDSPSRVLARLSVMQKEMMVKEFVHTAARGLGEKKETLSVELNPPDLGRIKIIVESRGDYVNARLAMPDKGLGEFFQEQLEGIRKSMEEAGIKLGELSVEVRQNFNLSPDKQENLEQKKSWENKESGGKNHARPAQALTRTGRGGEAGKVDMLV